MESNAYKAVEELESIPQVIPVESCEIPTPVLLRIIAAVVLSVFCIVSVLFR